MNAEQTKKDKDNTLKPFATRASSGKNFLPAEIFYWPASEKWNKPRAFTPKLEFQIVALLYLDDLSSISGQSVGQFPPKYPYLNYMETIVTVFVAIVVGAWLVLVNEGASLEIFWDSSSASTM